MKMVLHLGQDGKLCGASDADQRAYERFLAKVKALVGSVVVEYRVPRSGQFHRRFFAWLSAMFEAQEQFESFENFRRWAEVGAGHCVFVPGPHGRMVALPDSINYERLEQADFEVLDAQMMAFFRSAHATRFLFPHLSDADAYQSVDAVLSEFE